MRPKGLSYRRSLAFHATDMKIKILLLPERKKTKIIDIKKGSTVIDAIRAMDLYPDAWIPVRGDAPVPLDEVLREGDELKLIAVVSGG
jgi:sulfur carrier protein ThiS